MNHRRQTPIGGAAGGAAAAAASAGTTEFTATRDLLQLFLGQLFLVFAGVAHIRLRFGFDLFFFSVSSCSRGKSIGRAKSFPPKPGARQLERPSAHQFELKFHADITSGL